MEKLYVNGRFLAQKVTGVQRVAIEFLKSFNEINAELSIYVIVPRNVENQLVDRFSEEARLKIVRRGFLPSILWEQVELPFFVRDGYLLNLGNIVPLLKRRNIVYLHDISYYRNPSFFSPAFRIWYRLMVPLSLRRSRLVFTNSNFCKKEISDVYTCSAEIAYLGHEHVVKLKTEKFDEILASLNLKPNSYILAVGSISKNKNFSFLITAIEQLAIPDMKVIIIGGSSILFKSYEVLQSKNIEFVGYVDDEKLFALYQGAKFFVFPSIYEGFGIPPLEAAKLGTISIISSTTALPEIYGQHALYIDPLNLKSLMEKIETLWNNKNLIEEYENRLPELIGKYSWRESAKFILSKITSLDEGA